MISVLSNVLVLAFNAHWLSRNKHHTQDSCGQSYSYFTGATGYRRVTVSLQRSGNLLTFLWQSLPRQGFSYEKTNSGSGIPARCPGLPRLPPPSVHSKQSSSTLLSSSPSPLSPVLMALQCWGIKRKRSRGARFGCCRAIQRTVAEGGQAHRHLTKRPRRVGAMSHNAQDL